MHKYNKILPIGTVIDRPSSLAPAYLVKSYNIKDGIYYLFAATATDIRTIHTGKKMGVSVIEQDDRHYLSHFGIDEGLIQRMNSNRKLVIVPPNKAEMYLSRHPHYIPQKLNDFIRICQSLYPEWTMPRDRFIVQLKKYPARMLIDEDIPEVIPDPTHDKEPPPLERLMFGL